MRHTWRWFGPVDRVSVRDAAHAGAKGIVSALHHIPTGTAWTAAEIARRQAETRAGGLEWELVESIPVSESIKTQTGPWREHVAAWRESLRELAAAGDFHRLLQFHARPRLDPHRTALADAGRGARDALRSRRLCRFRPFHPGATGCGRVLSGRPS